MLERVDGGVGGDSGRQDQRARRLAPLVALSDSACASSHRAKRNRVAAVATASLGRWPR